MSKLILYHGSPEIIRQPVYGKGKPYNDYGKGFYCTEHEELAKEWACTENTDGYVNRYELETEGLKILNLGSDEYSILHWLALLMEYRKFRIATPIMKSGAEWLKKNFLIDISAYDAVVGYRADDSYFSFARSFVNNEVSLDRLMFSMHLGELGEQFVLKSPMAFEKIKFVSYKIADNTTYYARRKARDSGARAAYNAELEKGDIGGLYMRDIIIQEVKSNDPRLR